MYWLTGYDTFGYVFFQALVLDQKGNVILLTRAPDLRQAQNTSNISDIRIWVDKDEANPADDLKIILDELNPTVDLELLPVESIHQTLLKKPADTEVVITGRCKNEPSYFELADVYSEMVCHKHYANVGVDLKRGVDY